MRAVKVFEAKTLIESMEDRSQNYDDLREKLQHLKKKFTDVVQLDDSLQGKGATAIKGFYQGQIDVVEAWLRLIDRNIAFFNGISGMTEDVDLNGNTTVYLPFLEDELSHHETSYSAMVTSQQEELQTIVNQIDDLVPLNVFSMDRFNDQLAQAQKKRRSTIQAVESLDAELKTEYMLSENDEYYAVTLFQQLIEATRQGGNTISPIHFNAEAYKSSDVYKLKEQAEQQANEYLSYKEEQEKMREQLRELEELERRPWYEKAADTVRTFTGELTGYYDYIRASEGVDPVTGEEITEGQRVAAGAMAAAGFIPVVGWAGRIFKGGSAIYKTTKGVKAADQALDVYRSSKTFSNLEKAEMGIYGLVSANGFSEYLTGKDMFGNKLTVEQQENSLYQALGLMAVGGGAYYVNRLQAENGIYQVKRSSISKEINEKQDKAFYMELEDLLKQKDLSMKDFNDMRLKRVSELSTIEIQNMKEIRRSVSPINKDTMMQKVLPPSAKKWLFSSPNEGQIKIGGFLAKVTDTEALNTYDKIFEGLRLDYKGTAEWPNEYLTVDSALAIRFKSVEPDDYKIPFGGQNKDEVTKMIDGDNSDDFIDELQGDPFTGNGFTKSKSYIIPEYENRIKVDLYDGVELYEISKDGETLIAIYSQEDRKLLV